MAKVAVGFSCDIDDDADILTWLSQQENKSASIRRAIRGAWLQESVTLGDVLNELGEVKRMLRAGVVVNGGASKAETVEPLDPEQQIAQNILDGLGA